MGEFSYIGVRDGVGNDLKIVPELFGITQHDRRHHLYCIGKTGTGKTTLLHNLITQDIEAGRGVALLDPHGDLSRALLDFIPEHRVNDVVYLNPADLARPIGLNFFAKVAPDRRALVTNHILSVFTHIWGLSNETAPRLLNLLRNTVASLLEVQGTSLLSVYRMLIDENYRDRIVKRVTDSHIRQYWESVFAAYDPHQRGIVIDSTLNKVGALLSSPVIRNTVGQVANRIDFGRLMDKKKILICNLSKGELGEQESSLIGSILSIQIYLHTMARASRPEEDRAPFNLFVDEFQNFGGSVFAEIVSESRKYGLVLTLAHQFMAQLELPVLEAVIGNVGSIISFRVGSNDAQVLAREFSEQGGLVSATAFSDLDSYEIRARLLENGSVQTQFRAKTVPPAGKRYGLAESVIRHSRDHYGTPREIVESRAEAWMGR